MSIKFRPVQGTKDKIKDAPYCEGYIYFATDTGSIYLDTQGERKPIGGGGVDVMYASAAVVIENVDGSYSMQMSDLDDPTAAVSADDLIINSDGRFFKVTHADDTMITCNLIAVSGTGGGGGGGDNPSAPTATIKIEAIEPVRGPYIYGQPAYITYKVTATEDFNITYTYTIQSSDGQRKVIQKSAESGKEYTFDIGSELYSGLNLIIVAANGANSGDVSRRYTNVNCIEMLLEESQNFSPLQVVAEGELIFRCRPVGAGLTKTLKISIDGEPRAELTQTVTSSGQDVPISITGLKHGRHSIKATLSTGSGTTEVSATPLEYEIAWVEPGNTNPIIWFDSYPSKIVDHDKLNVYYKVYNPEKVEKAEVHLFADQVELPTSPIDVGYDLGNLKWELWAITDYHLGTNVFTISCGSTSETIEVVVEKDELRQLDVLTAGLALNLESKGRSNRENKTSKTKWEYVAPNGTVTAVQFNNFNWYNNGWIVDDEGDSCLRISNGASISIPLSVMNTTTLGTGLTFEFIFKLRNVQNLSTLITTTSTENEETGEVKITKTINIEEGVFGSYFGNDCGFCLGTQEAFFKSTGNSVVNARYTDGQIVHLSFVVESSTTNKPLMYIYLNGILSGIANYSTTADNFNALVQEFTINSDYCDVDLYKMRVYKSQLSSIDIVHNYIADLADANLYDMNQITDFVNNIPKVNYSKIIDYNINNPDNQTMPYAVVEISQADDKPNDERLPFVKGGKRKLDVTFVNPWLDRAFETGKITEEQYIAGCPSFTSKAAEFDVQGTSSQGYPRRNFKGKFKKCSEWKYTNGGDNINGKSLLEKITIGGKEWKGYYMDNKDASETTFTWKADYMESSGTHNTGYTSFVKTLYSQHPLVDYLGDDYVTGDHRTTIYGFPMMVFQRYHDGTYDFVGKYNFNLDKACNNVIDFENETAHPYVEGKTFKDVAQCWEFKNNQGTRCSFRKVDFDEVDDKGALTLLGDLEYRYNHDEDKFDDAMDVKKEVFPTQEAANSYILNEFSELEKLFIWLDETNTDKATNETFDAPRTFTSATGVVSKEYTKDDAEYRLAKFTYEFTKHFNTEYCYIYFIMTELLIGYDSRGKNMMLASWGPQEEDGEYIWYPIFYDVDTQLGVNNSGVPTWEYDTEATADKQFSTADSILWNNLWSCFADSIKSKYIDLRKKALTIENLNGYYDFDPAISKSYAMMGCRPLNVYNIDEYYKYIAPAFTGYLDTSGNTAITSLYFYCLQGTRELQRELFLRNRFNYLDSCWLGGPYAEEAVLQELKIRYNANDAINTSDKFVTVEPADTTTDTWQAFLRNGGSVKPYKENALDADLTFEITPYLKQYVGMYYDSIPSTPIRFDGENPVALTATPAVQKSIEETVGFSQQLIYFGGVEYISKFGDLSLKYANEFAMNKAIRLKELYLGSELTGYSNGLMSDEYFDLAAGATALDDTGKVISNPYGKPLLETIVLTNIGSISSPQDLTSCEKLKTFRALGTSLGGITLASGTIIDTLYLPNTITFFDLVEPIELDTILTTKPVANADGEFPKGLYIDGLTNIGTVTTASTTKINRLDITGGNMGYKSYVLADKLVDIKEAMQQNSELASTFSKDLRIRLEDVKWTPYRKVDAGEIVIEGATYVKKTEHYTFESYTPGADWDADTLNGKVYEVDTTVLANEANTLTDLSLLDKFIASYESNENYLKSTTEYPDGRKTIPIVSGDIFINNTTPIAEAALKNTYKDKYFPELNIFVKTVSESLVAKFIEILDSGVEYEWDAQKYEKGTVTSPSPTAVIPTKLHYDFKGWADKPNATVADVITDWTKYQYSDDVTVYVFYAVYDKHPYKITYNNYDKSLIEEVYVPYLDPVKEPKKTPYKDDSKLDFDKRYKFVGWTTDPLSTEITNQNQIKDVVVDVTTYKAIKDYTFYACFMQESVYASTLDEKYFSTALMTYVDRFEAVYNSEVDGGVQVNFNPEFKPSGKITIPAYVTHDGLRKPVLAIGNSGMSFGGGGEDVTHIFFENGTQVRLFDESAFSQNPKLVYVEMPPTLRSIRQAAFSSVPMLTNNSFGGVIAEIGQAAFNQSYSSPVGIDITVGPECIDLASRAFSYMNTPINSMMIGSPDAPSKIATIGSEALIQNEGLECKMLTIYCSTANEALFREAIADGRLQCLDHEIVLV